MTSQQINFFQERIARLKSNLKGAPSGGIYTQILMRDIGKYERALFRAMAGDKTADYSDDEVYSSDDDDEGKTDEGKADDGKE